MKINRILIAFFALILILNPINAQTTDYDIINLNADTYNYTPTPVISGEEFEIWIQLTNKSNLPAENIEYFLEVDYPFILVSENEEKINKIEPYQSKIIKYKLKTYGDTLTGTYDLDFRYTREGIFVYNVKKYTIDVKGKNAIIEVISSNIKNTNIGSSSEIILNLKNLGQKDSKDIFITLGDSLDETIKVIGLKTQYLEKINVNEQKEVTFKLDISKNIINSSYTLPITINYSDVDREYTIERNIGFRIEDEPKMILNIVNIGKDFKIKPNSLEKISLEIYNIGNVDTEVSYIIVEGEGINQTQEFIGSIEKDNYDRLEIDLKTKDIKEKETNITVNLFYKDSYLQEQKITKTITVETDFTTNGQKANSLIMSLFGIIGFIVGLALFILIARWLIKILIKPAYKVILNIFKKK